jgi:REP element-mobilizing transposase RayT
MAQLALQLPSTWGGQRAGAGRKPIPGRRRPTAHARWPTHKAAHPVHVTLRVRTGFSSLRSSQLSAVLRRALAAATRSSFHVVHFSVQDDHVHLLVEGDDARALSRGVSGLVIRAARALNRALGRTGRVWGDRYHSALTTPREVRHALVYVVMNWKKHRPWERLSLDPCSSARWFDGFEGRIQPTNLSVFSRPRTWLAAVGWRKHGLIRLEEGPIPPTKRSGWTRPSGTSLPH